MERAKIFEIDEYEHDLIKNNNIKEYDQIMIYKAKAIGNNNKYKSWCCHIESGLIYEEFVYELSGIVINIRKKTIYDYRSKYKNTTYEIGIHKGSDEMLYLSNTKYIHGDWEIIFDKLYEEAINKKNIESKTYIKKGITLK